jgi:hypothetical protein
MCTTQICGDACVDVESDPMNCGGCGHQCMGTAQCCSGVCNETPSCATLSVTKIDSPLMGQGWQSGGDYITLHGTGFAKPMKVHLGDGRAAVRVVDAQTALVKTPPGPLGVVDVRVDVGGQTAIMQGGFRYRSGDLMTPWQQKPLSKVRGEDPGIAVLQDGRTLVAGGTTVPDSTAQALDTAEIYTRSSDTVAPAANSMSAPRWQNSAVTLLDGRALVVGGACDDDLTNCNGDPTSADLFDPKTNTFTPTKMKLNVPRVYTRAILLSDGRVLISSANAADFEVYDPDADTFTLVKNTASGKAHVFGFIALLRDGRALVGAGDATNTTVDVFDPDTNMVTATGALIQGRSMLTAHTLPDGRVLVIGGASASAGGIVDPLDSIEAFDPKTAMWTTMPYKMSIGRAWHASALVRDGTILAMGGYTLHGACDSLVDTVDQIDPVIGSVKPFAVLPNKNTEWTAVTLLDGSVLGVGGGACGTSMALPDIDFLPGAPTPM